MRRSKLGWKGAVAAGLVVAALLPALIRYGEWVVAFADANLRVALPDDLALVSPGPDVPPAIAAFAGIWGGDRWDGALPTALAVEKVAADGTATIVYGWGADTEQHRPHGWLRAKARVADGHLGVVLPDGSALDYAPAADGRLLGRMTSATEWRRYALLQRVVAPDLAASRALAARRAAPLWQDIAIPESAMVGDAAGQSLTLQATLYRTQRPGRQPLVVLNPGSDDERNPGVVVRDEPAARFLVSLGYSVVVPMRKGRGGSGGPMIEAGDFAGPPSPELQIESGIEDIDAVVEHMKRQSYVDPGRIVVAGNQHGGLLAVAYAGRHPEGVSAVVDIAGGWWPEGYQGGRLNTDIAAAAGRTATAPALFLYAEDDPLWSLPHAERIVAAFRAAGARGRLVAFPDPGAPKIFGTHLFDWTAKWEDIVADFLAPPPARPLTAGLARFGIQDPLGDGVLPLAVFYPSAVAPRRTLADQRAVDAASDAPLADGRFPVILLSPPYGGDRLSQHDSASALARDGFIVVALSHPGEDPLVPGAWRRDRVLLGREYDLRAALDAVLADPLLGAHADRDRVGVAGIGLGGYAALLLAGGRPDLARVAAFCRARLDPTCAGNEAPPTVRAGLAPFRDVRVKAALLMAPAAGYLFPDDGLREVAVPVRIYRAGSDHRPSSPYDAARIRALLPAPEDYIEVGSAGPEAFLAPCSAALRRSDPQSCIDSSALDRVALHARLNAEMADFFRRTLAPPG